MEAHKIPQSRAEDTGVYTSPYNRVPDVVDQFDFAPKIIVNDCTLREGEQASEVSFSLDEKVEIGRELAEVGIPQIQGGYPGRSASDLQAIARLKQENLSLTIEAVAQVFQADWKEQIDKSVDSGADIVSLIYPSSDVRLKYVQRATRSQMLERSVEACAYAKERGAKTVRFSPTDTWRTDLVFLKQVFEETVAAGASRITMSDTSGSAHPASIRYLVREVKQWIQCPVHVHHHNDFGLGLANVLAAAEAGADILDGTLCGLGERSGNPSLDEVVAALTFLYGLDLGVDTAGLGKLTKKMADRAGVVIPPTKPLVGAHAFSHKIDAHVYGILQFPGTYEPVDPERVGGKRHFPVGKYSGQAVLGARLDQLNIGIEASKLSELAREIEAEAVRLKRQLQDDELVRLAERYT